MPTQITGTLIVSPVAITGTLAAAPVQITGTLTARDGRDGTDGGIVATAPAAEAISAARGVYLALDGATVKVYLASATDATKAAQGFIVVAVSAGTSVTVYNAGPITGLSGITPQQPYYLGAAGQFVSAPPSGAAIIQRLGTGAGTDRIAGLVEPPVEVV